MSGGAAGGAAAVSLTRTPATPEPTGTPGQGAGLAEGRRSDPGGAGLRRVRGPPPANGAPSGVWECQLVGPESWAGCDS